MHLKILCPPPGNCPGGRNFRGGQQGVQGGGRCPHCPLPLYPPLTTPLLIFVIDGLIELKMIYDEYKISIHNVAIPSSIYNWIGNFYNEKFSIERSIVLFLWNASEKFLHRDNVHCTRHTKKFTFGAVCFVYFINCLLNS